MIQKIPEKTFIDPRVEMRKSWIEWDGLYAIAPIKKWKIVIHRWWWEIITDDEFQKWFKEGKYQAESTIHFDEHHKWVSLASEPDYADAAINHSCNPNLWFENWWPLVAIRDIEKGEELTFDYATGETYSLQRECNCGAENCRKFISGEEWRDQTFQKKHENHFNPYIQGLIDKEKNIKN